YHVLAWIDRDDARAVPLVLGQRLRAGHGVDEVDVQLVQELQRLVDGCVARAVGDAQVQRVLVPGWCAGPGECAGDAVQVDDDVGGLGVRFDPGALARGGRAGDDVQHEASPPS